MWTIAIGDFLTGMEWLLLLQSLINVKESWTALDPWVLGNTEVA